MTVTMPRMNAIVSPEADLAARKAKLFELHAVVKEAFATKKRAREEHHAAQTRFRMLIEMDSTKAERLEARDATNEGFRHYCLASDILTKARRDYHDEFDRTMREWSRGSNLPDLHHAPSAPELFEP